MGTFDVVGEAACTQGLSLGDTAYFEFRVKGRWPVVKAAENVFVAVNIRIDAITTTSFTSEDFTVEDTDGTSYPEASPG